MRRTVAAVTCVAITLIAGATTSHAEPVTTLYVDRTMSACSDIGSGTLTEPFCTITKGVSRMQPGYALYIGNGTYAESIKPAVSGTAAAPITISAWPGRSPVVGTGVTYGAYLSTRSYITVSNLTFTGTTGDGIYVTKSDHATITGNTVTYAGEQAHSLTARGISISSTTASVVSNNNTNHNSDTGIYVTGTSTGITVSNNQSSFNAEGWQRNANGINVTSPGNTVIGNVTHDNEDSGMQFFSGANNSLATLNVTYNNGDHGIDNYNVTGGRIIGNTVYRNCTSGINVEGTSGNFLIANNIAVDNAVYPAYSGISCARRAGNIGVWDSAPPTTVVDHNLVWLTKAGTMYVFKSSYTSLSSMQAATGQEQAGVQADPRFLSTSGSDLRLTEGSPAIDRADSGLSGEQPVDILGNPRVPDPNVTNTFAAGPRLYDDLGAYEFQPTTAPPPGPSADRRPERHPDDRAGPSPGHRQRLRVHRPPRPNPLLRLQLRRRHHHPSPGRRHRHPHLLQRRDLHRHRHRHQHLGPEQHRPGRDHHHRPTPGPSADRRPQRHPDDRAGPSPGHRQRLRVHRPPGPDPVLRLQLRRRHHHRRPARRHRHPHLHHRRDLHRHRHRHQHLRPEQHRPGQHHHHRPTPLTNPPAYVNQIATNYSTSTKTSGYITVWRPAGVLTGSLVVLTLQLSNTAPTGPITATDDRGNTYTVASSIANATGGRLVVLSGTASQPLAVGAKITATFPSSTGYRMLGDEFTGVRNVDTTATATGTATTFSSGLTATTSTAGEVVYGSVAMFGGTANPVWASGWKDMATYAVVPNYLGRAYRLPTAAGSFAATGSASGSWLAVTVAFAP